MNKYLWLVGGIILFLVLLVIISRKRSVTFKEFLNTYYTKNYSLTKNNIEKELEKMVPGSIVNGKENNEKILEGICSYINSYKQGNKLSRDKLEIFILLFFTKQQLNSNENYKDIISYDGSNIRFKVRRGGPMDPFYGNDLANKYLIDDYNGYGIPADEFYSIFQGFPLFDKC